MGSVWSLDSSDCNLNAGGKVRWNVWVDDLTYDSAWDWEWMCLIHKGRVKKTTTRNRQPTTDSSSQRLPWPKVPPHQNGSRLEREKEMCIRCCFCGWPILYPDKFVSFRRFDTPFYDHWHQTPRDCWREYEREIREQTKALKEMEMRWTNRYQKFCVQNATCFLPSGRLNVSIADSR